MYSIKFSLLRLIFVAVRKQCVTYSECVSVACYPVRKAHAPCYIISGLSGCITSFHIVSHTVRFRKRVTKYEMWVMIFPTVLLETFLILIRFQ
jgi:hypothetical protein